jgi:CheY-like chemotaxis protein
MYLKKTDPIVVVEDDPDDQELLKYICKSLDIKNELLFFDNGIDAYNYLTTTTAKTFIILCDINLPMIDGIELRDKIEKNEELKRKSIPFVFMSTAATKSQVEKAYLLAVQGFFLKAMSFKEFERKLRIIFEYWQECITPNTDF